MKIQLLFIFSALLMLSCGGNRKAGAEVASDPVEETDFFVFDYEGSFKSTPKATTLNELTDSISYIPLETHKDALLPSDHHLFAKIGGDLFINGGSARRASPIYQFDSLGRFVKQITHIGRGPNEVLITMFWHANSNLRQINIVDIAYKMVVVQTESGERSTIKINSSQGLKIAPLNDSTFVSANSLMSNEPHKAYLYFIDRTGNLVHSIERDDELLSYNANSSESGQYPPYENYWLVPDYKGDAIFHDIFNDTLYRIKSHSEITPHLVFKRGALSPRPEDKQKPENKKKQVYFTSVMESSNNIFLTYSYGGKTCCDVWSKRDGSLTLRTIPKRAYPFDVFLPFALPDGTTIDIQVVYADRDNIYCVLEALDAVKFMPGIKEDDNPIIMVAKLKK